MVPLLKAIALQVCVQLAGRITDVGSTPYGLVKPILKKMTLKQLAIVETNSPTVMPESDEVWGLLIEKDFPDRPIHGGTKQELVIGELTDMPNRALYKKYMEERDIFRASSAQRLRKMTEKLRKEKSKNSITPIPSIIRTTPIRRNYNGDPLLRYSSSSRSPKTILGKAMKDIQQRKLMFGNNRRPTYDAYTEFRKRPPPSSSPLMPRLKLLHQKEQAVPKASVQSAQPPRLSSPPSGHQTSPKKRPGEPVIFLPKKKMPPRAPRIPPELKQDIKQQPHSPKGALKPKVKLSIFH